MNSIAVLGFIEAMPGNTVLSMPMSTANALQAVGPTAIAENLHLSIEQDQL
jgi:hypothetical protein